MAQSASGFVGNSGRERRRKIVAGLVANGRAIVEVAKEYGVSATTVRNACREYGVAIPRKSAPSVYLIIAALQQGATVTEAAERAGCDRRWVLRVRERALAAGVKFEREGQA